MISISAREVSLPDPQRGWATLVSFSLQTVGLVLLLMLPMLYPGMLPRVELTPPLVMMSPMPAAPPTAPGPMAHGSRPLLPTPLVAPPSVPTSTPLIEDAPEIPNNGGCPGCIVGTSARNSVLSTFAPMGSVLPPPPPKPAVAPKPIHLSHAMDAYLVRKVQPEYPRIALTARQQGAVVIEAVISREGTIENLQVVSGPPLLVKAAVDAVKQWRYRPYLLNGEPVEVQTQVTVNFVLGGR